MSGPILSQYSILRQNPSTLLPEKAKKYFLVKSHEYAYLTIFLSITGHINLGKKGYRVPPKGTIQVTLFNPLGTVVKMFVVMYDLSDMPPNSQTFLRQRTLYMPSEGVNDAELQKWLRYLVHLRYE